MAAEAYAAATACFHCGLPIPPGPPILVEILGEDRDMCCNGCRAVAELLVNQGLSDWYTRREQATGVPGSVLEDLYADTTLLDEEVFEDEFITTGTHDGAAATLLVDGIHCAACVWVIERHLLTLDGVHDVRVNLATHRAHIEWDPLKTGLRELVIGLATIGFEARPDRPGEAAAIDLRDHRSALIRIAVAGFATMNVMTYSVALYAGEFEGMAAGYQALMRWAGLLVSTPVLLYSARPFFSAAIRDLRLARPGMDVPVALAIGGAYGVSSYATWTGTGEVYFDSVCMFTFLLSVGRYIEMRIRHRTTSLTRDMVDATPLIARRENNGLEEIVRAEALAVGDLFRVRPGETVPADGFIQEGTSSVEEALLTGEAWPRAIEEGSNVIAGSVNIESPLLVEATRVGNATTLARIASLIDRAQAHRPRVAHLADRVATIFVSCVLAIAAVNAVAWSIIDPERAIWTTLAVLVATCPCALSLATPAALAAATDGFARAGLLITKGRFFEKLDEIDCFVFDKTGTLTRGETRVASTVPFPGHQVEDALEIARVLESDSEHPVARAFIPSPSGRYSTSDRAQKMRGNHLHSTPGSGVEGTVDGTRYRIGRPEWVRGSNLGPPLGEPDSAHSWILLGSEHGLVAWFGIEDSIREDASSTLQELTTHDVALELLSGDPSQSGRAVAQTLDFSTARFGVTPEGKVARVQELQAEGKRVAVVGDGINDAPLLNAADVSIAMGSGCDLSRLGADAVLMHDDLTLLPRAIDGARRVRRVVMQNFAWAIGYNAIALPLAVTGHLSPWLAAIGMSTSSLVVVLNALRLRQPGRGGTRSSEGRGATIP